MDSRWEGAKRAIDVGPKAQRTSIERSNAVRSMGLKGWGTRMFAFYKTKKRKRAQLNVTTEGTKDKKKGQIMRECDPKPNV